MQFPAKENGNEAICHAIAESKTGEVFSDIGDANPKNCHSQIVKHLIRMASTRAKARCLRDLCNISMAAVEELADFDDVIGTDKPKNASRKKAAGNTDKKAPKAKTDAKKKSPVKDKPEPKAKSKQPTKSEDEKSKVEPKEKTASTQPNMSEAQKRAIYNLSRRRGISVEELEKMASDAYGSELEDLNSKDASTFIRNLQQAA